MRWRGHRGNIRRVACFSVRDTYWRPTRSLFVSCRTVIQSNDSRGLRSPLDQYEDFKLVMQLRRNGRGNYYRYQQKLWPSVEMLEKELTEKLYSSTERAPLALLPRPKGSTLHRETCVLEGNGAITLLEDVCSSLQHSEYAGEGVKNSVALHDSVGSVEEANPALCEAGGDIESKIITENDLEGTVLEAARERARTVIWDDLRVNEATTSRTNIPDVLKRALPSAREEGGVVWEALGLCPVLSSRVMDVLGGAPTRLQSRLLPALLHEDHNDVLFNGVTGSGKTSALIIALLHAVRTEAAGFNVFVASNMIAAMRAYDKVKALCGDMGGLMVDRPKEDFSWLFMGIFSGEYDSYYHDLRRSLHSDHGPVRLLITTADTMCQLLFEKKMEFEAFGYLRRVYVDDIGVQLPMVPPNAPVHEMRERLRNPLPCELLLGTLHQLPGPHIRSILQLGLVSADMEPTLKDHLKALCVKLERHTIVLSAVRIPSTIHCLFSFHLPYEDVYQHVVQLIWNARRTIPGRAIIYIRYEDDILQVRTKLRRLGMDAKLFSEIYHEGEFRDSWKFLLLREAEAFGLNLPFVSHVFITFCPRSICSFQHMCGRTGRLGNVGWVYTVTDKREAKAVREIATHLEVDFCNHVVDVNLVQVVPSDVDRLTKEFELYGLDPQYAVKQHYIVQSENPDMAYRSREFFSKPARKQFQMEDYTPVPELHRRFVNSKKLAKDIERNPSIAISLQQKGLLNEKLAPTRKLKNLLNRKSRASNAPVYNVGGRP